MKYAAVIISASVLAACGGGGGGGGSVPSVIRPTTITGTVTPPTTPLSGTGGSPDLRPPPNFSYAWPALVQSMDYTFDPASAAATPATLKVTVLNINPVNTDGAFGISAGNSAYPTDPGLGQTNQVQLLINGVQIGWLNIAAGAVAAQSTLGGLPTVQLVNTAAASAAAYVLPYSATLNPTGYTYQTFGVWGIHSGGATFSEIYFSAGAAVDPVTLPAAGTASYTGHVLGSIVYASNNDPGDITATMNATADFGARTVAFSTTGTTSLSNNAAPGAVASANPGLNMSGTLSYTAGSNTFTGTVTTVNGMSGNATGRFYGPGIGAPTGTKVAGSPPEIGGTFAVMQTGVGAMQGAFGGN